MFEKIPQNLSGFKPTEVTRHAHCICDWEVGRGALFGANTWVQADGTATVNFRMSMAKRKGSEDHALAIPDSSLQWTPASSAYHPMA